ncbi:hypothetical protein pb186bvf_010839 [Paramecium bursaria]
MDQLRDGAQPNSITIKIKVDFGDFAQKIYEIEMPKDSPFTSVVNFVKEQLFTDKNKSVVDEAKVEFLFNRSLIQQSETRTIDQLQIKDEQEISVKVPLKGG